MIFYNIKRKVNEIFFSEEPDWYWGLFCILFPIIVINNILNNIIHKEFLFTHHHLYYPLPLFEFIGIPDPLFVKTAIEEFLSLTVSLASLFFILKITLIISLIFSVLGLFQKFFIALSLISFFFFQGWLYGYFRTAENPHVFHNANIVCFILLVWLFSPPCKRWTVLVWIREFLKKADLKENMKKVNVVRYPVWPRLLVILTIAITFFGSFYCKFDTSGFKWINGYNLQGHLLASSIDHPFSKAYWLAQQNFYLIWFLNIGVWIFQSTAPIGFFLKRTRLLYGLMGIVFHICIFVFFGFLFEPFLYCYVVFIPEAVRFFQKVKSKFI